MDTQAFITYMSARLNGNLSREQILNMTNRAQNEILSNDNRLTRIVPDPFIHTGATLANSDNASNVAGNFTYVIQSSIPTTTATKGFLLINENSITDRLEYTDYSGSTFTLADDVSLPRTYTDQATTAIDTFEIIASGGIFSSEPNKTTQWDIRRVTRVYAFTTRTGGYPWAGYGYFGGRGVNNISYKPDKRSNLNVPEIDIQTDTNESLEADSADCKIRWWRENDPGESTDVFMARCQRWPQQVTTEQIPLTIPDRFQTNLLRYAILRDVEYTEYGRNDRPEGLYEKYLDEFLTWAAAGVDTTTRTSTVPKEF